VSSSIDSGANMAVAEPWWRRAAAYRSRTLATFAIVAIIVGGIAALSGNGELGRRIWFGAVLVLSIDLTYEVLRTIIVERHLGVDTIALVAMVGALILGEELAGAVVGLMFSGGAALEAAAARRARRDLTELVRRAPRTATRLLAGGGLEQVAVDQVDAGDVLVVRTGELIPVDGTLTSPSASIDTSTLTGEPLPVDMRAGAQLLSGTANAGAPFELRAERPAAASAYAALVRLVRHAESERAPFVRMADRYAGFFLQVTLVLAGLAWALSGDPVRALAVVVVATPCPLILAAPIALVSGVSRAARAGVIVKDAGVIETLGQARSVIIDKTGTLTSGKPEIREIVPVAEGADADHVLLLAASVELLSTHALASALVDAARRRGLDPQPATETTELPGQGISGTVAGRRVAVGSDDYIAALGSGLDEAHAARAAGGHGSGEARIVVAVDAELAAVIVMADELRPDAGAAIGRLRQEGVGYIALASGDRRSVAERVGTELGLDAVFAEMTPESKLERITEVRADAARAPVVMVGDGINDAPALAAADVGIAMGAAGATVSSETADAVVTVDRIERVADALHIGRRAMTIARQSVLVGMGLSIVAMFVAAAGYLPPVAGALLQEVIDLAVILNALRALRG